MTEITRTLFEGIRRMTWREIDKNTPRDGTIVLVKRKDGKDVWPGFPVVMAYWGRTRRFKKSVWLSCMGPTPYEDEFTCVEQPDLWMELPA